MDFEFIFVILCTALQREASIEVDVMVKFNFLSSEYEDNDTHDKYNTLDEDKGDMGSRKRSYYRGIDAAQP